jgi:hypothetical protein
MPDNRDDVYRIITRLIEEFMEGSGLPPGSRFRGYAILTGPGGIPAMIRIHAGEHRDLIPEVIEGDGEVWVSAALPPVSVTVPSVTFQPLFVEISLGTETVAVNLPCRIDPGDCSWQVRNGVLDISCRKA